MRWYSNGLTPINQGHAWLGHYTEAMRKHPAIQYKLTQELAKREANVSRAWGIARNLTRKGATRKAPSGKEASKMVRGLLAG